MDRRPEGTQGFTVYLKDPLWKRLKMQAAEEKRPMVRIIEDATRNYLDLVEASGRKS